MESIPIFHVNAVCFLSLNTEGGWKWKDKRFRVSLSVNRSLSSLGRRFWGPHMAQAWSRLGLLTEEDWKGFSTHPARAVVGQIQAGIAPGVWRLD